MGAKASSIKKKEDEQTSYVQREKIATKSEENLKFYPRAKPANAYACKICMLGRIKDPNEAKRKDFKGLAKCIWFGMVSKRVQKKRRNLQITLTKIIR